MIQYKIKNKTSIRVNESYLGEPIETKIERVTTNKEPITDEAPIIFTERKMGVMPGYDIRTDRFEVAIDAMHKVNKSRIAKSTEKPESGDEKPAGGDEKPAA